MENRSKSAGKLKLRPATAQDIQIYNAMVVNKYHKNGYPQIKSVEQFQPKEEAEPVSGGATQVIGGRTYTQSEDGTWTGEDGTWTAK